MHIILVTRHFEGRQKADDTNWVKGVELVHLHYHLKTLRQFCDVPGDFVAIFRRRVRQVVCLEIHCLPKVVFSDADDLDPLILVALAAMAISGSFLLDVGIAVA